ncbi:MAG: hypothetical protein WBK36_02710, partial [Bacillota bacterium]
MGYRIRKYGLVIGDVICVLVSFALAMLIRFDFSTSRALPYVSVVARRLPILLAVRLCIYY